MKKKYVNIKSPFTGGKVLEIRDTEEKTFRGEKYTIDVVYYQCEDTGEQFTTPQQDDLWTSELYNQYRVKHGIPFPEEIKSIRASYGLNYTQMSRILGFGINQLKTYEEGTVPSESNGKMLKMASDPMTMMNLLEISCNEFSTSEYDNLKQKIAVNCFEKIRKRGFAVSSLFAPSLQ